MTKKILICDDELGVAQSFKDRLEELENIKSNFIVNTIASDDLYRSVKALEDRLVSAIKGTQSKYPSNDEAVIFDEADILILDYELIKMSASVTGERIAYLARCYSCCGLIVGLNQYPPYGEEYFDLTLRGHPESYADMNISGDSLNNQGLWSSPWYAFRPWSWPLLPLALEKFKRRVTDLHGHLGDRILDYLGFREDRSLTMPRKLVEFISRQAESVYETTFVQFVELSGNGLRGRLDKPINEEAVARIAAARIGCWLEHAVLQRQDILVDAPHLVARFPSLLLKDPSNVETWNQTANTFELKRLGLSPLLESSQFLHEDWLSRPAWFWNELRDNEEISEVKDPWSILRPEHMFCEDISKFEHREKTRKFLADVDSPYARRFVMHLSDIQYTPSVRFSL